MIQEYIIKRVKLELYNKFGNCTYKKVQISNLLEYRLYWKVMTNKKVDEIFKNNNESKIDINSTLNEIIKNNLRNEEIYSWTRIKSYVKDLLFMFRHFKITIFEQNTNVDIIIAVTHKKFINYSQELKFSLTRQGYIVKYMLSEHFDLKGYSNSDSNEILPRVVSCSFFLKRLYYATPPGFFISIDCVYRTLKYYKPKKVIVFEGDSDFDFMIGHLGVNLGFKTFCLQWGYVGTSVAKMGWYRMPYDSFLAWGDFFKEKFQQWNVKLNIVSVGHPKMSSSENNNQHIILFAVQKVMKPFIREDDLKMFIETAIETAVKHPNKTIRIRSHPNYKIDDSLKEKYKSLNNIEWHDYYSYSIEQSMTNTICCVNICSTLSFECLNFNVIPIYLKISKIPFLMHEDISELFASSIPLVVTSEELQDTIINIHNVTILKDVKQMLFKYTGSTALENILNEITH